MVAPDRVLSMGQIELFDIETVHKQMTIYNYTWNKTEFLKIELFDHLHTVVCKQMTELLVGHNNPWNYLTVCK